MKKTVFSLLLCLMLCLGLAGCANVPDEIVGVYELTSASGSVNGTTVTTDLYAYYTIELTKDGKAIIKSKPAGIGGQEYEATAKFSFKDGKLEIKSSVGAGTVTETMDLSDGVITYLIDSNGISMTLVLTKNSVPQE